LKGIINFCDRYLSDEQNVLINALAIKPFHEQFGMISRQLKRVSPSVFQNLSLPNFESFRWNDHQIKRDYLYALKTNAEYALTYVESAFAESEMQQQKPGPVELVSQILLRFEAAVDRLIRRPGNRLALLRIEKEKDLQDILHGFLQLHFDDIRREEAVGSHGGANSAIDFLLKGEQIGIEVKGPRDGLKDIQAGSELLEDVAKYENHQDCKVLFFFIYDPERQLSNPAGIVRDLQAKSKPGFNVRVIIVPPIH